MSKINHWVGCIVNMFDATDSYSLKVLVMNPVAARFVAL